MFRLIESTDFQVTPFPHLVKDDFMEPHDYSALMSELKEIEKAKRRVWSGDSDKVVNPTEWVKDSENAENYPMAKSVMEYFSSKNFYTPLINEWSKYFPSRLKITSDNITNRVSELSNCGLKFDAAGDFVKIRDPHIDAPTNIMVWLFYCRLPEDSSKGGDLTLFSFKRGFRGFRIDNLVDARHLPARDIKLERTVEFKTNRLVAFMNGRDSIHGITDRHYGNVSRVKFHGGLASDDVRLETSLENSPIWKLFYHPLKIAQRVLIRVKTTFGGRANY